MTFPPPSTDGAAAEKERSAGGREEGREEGRKEGREERARDRREGSFPTKLLRSLRVRGARPRLKEESRT
jgi:predicted transposase YdaD